MLFVLFHFLFLFLFEKRYLPIALPACPPSCPRCQPACDEGGKEEKKIFCLSKKGTSFPKEHKKGTCFWFLLLFVGGAGQCCHPRKVLVSALLQGLFGMLVLKLCRDEAQGLADLSVFLQNAEVLEVKGRKG